MAKKPLSSQVVDALAALEPGLDPLQAVERLRRLLAPEEARAAALLLELRARAEGKLANASELFLTRKGLEQATDYRVAALRAATIAERGGGRWVFDATAGVGSDTRALAAIGLRVLGSDLDPETARCAAANLGLDLDVVILRADALGPPLRDPSGGLLVLDPDRRPPGAKQIHGAGVRAGHPDRWSPPLGASLEIAARFAGATLKLPPATDPERIPIDPGLPHAWRWVSLGGELKELGLMLGCLASGAAPREALVLDNAGKPTRLAGEPRTCPPLDDAGAAATPWLLDPDPAVIRSGLLGNLAEELGAQPLHARMAYLGAEERPETGLGRAYRVLGSTPLDPRRVRSMLAEHDVGGLTVKKRGHAESAETLAARLRGKGSRRGLLLVARLERGHRAYLVEPTGAEDSYGI